MTRLEALSIMKLQTDFTSQELKEAFRSQAKKVHPDHSGYSEDFKLLKAAYDYLKNSKVKRVFDIDDLSSLNLDIDAKISVSFHDACTGCIKKIKFLRHELYTNETLCAICRGRGWICREARSIEKCNVCDQRRYPQTIEKNIRIPAGIINKNKLSFKDEGSRVDNRSGALIITVSVEEASGLIRKDYNIVQTKDVKYSDLLLGKSLIANTVHGDVKVDIPFGSFDGDVLRVKGRGIKSKNKTGHHIVKLRLVAPSALTDDQRNALEVLRASGL